MALTNAYSASSLVIVNDTFMEAFTSASVYATIWNSKFAAVFGLIVKILFSSYDKMGSSYFVLPSASSNKEMDEIGQNLISLDLNSAFISIVNLPSLTALSLVISLPFGVVTAS